METLRPSISVVICTHNRSALLKKALDSLRAMTDVDAIEWEVCVVDNNSSDGTASMVREYGGCGAFFPLRYVHEHRQGIAYARNAGVTASGADVIAFVDDDVVVGQTWLRELHAGFLADPELSVMGGRLTANAESSTPSWMSDLNLAPIGLVDFGEKRQVLNVPYLATANCAFRRAAIISAGMFDVRRGRQPHKLYADEDTNMIARILRAGGKVSYEPAIAARHWVPNHRMTRVYFRRWYYERGEGVGLVAAEEGRSLFGIALYEYHKALVSLAAYFLRFITRKSVFQQELDIDYFAGIVVGRLKSVLTRGRRA